VDVDFSRDNKWLASASRQGDEKIGFTSQTELWSGPYWKPLGTMYESQKGITNIAFSPDSNHFAIGVTSPEYKKNLVLINNTYSWKTEQIIYTDTVLDFGFSADSLMIGTTPNRYAIKVWDMKKKQWVGTYYTSFTGAVNKIVFSPVEPIMASGHYDGFIRLWNIATNELLYEIQTGSVVESLSFNKDGTLLVSGGGFERHDIDIWNVDTGEKVKTLIGHTNAVTNLSFSPDGRILVSASYDGKIILWGVKK
jgi:WD40 repeat protein